MTKGMRRTVLFFVLLILLIPSFYARAGSVEEVKSRKKLIMLCHPDPMGFVHRTSDGQYEGLDVAIMKTFANTLGVALEVAPLETFNQLIPALLAGKGDVIASSMTITSEREKIVGFSDPYFPVVMMVVVSKDSKIAGLSDLDGKEQRSPAERSWKSG